MFFMFVAFIAIPSASHADVTGRVVAVTVGDTIKVLGGSKMQYTIFLKGIAAPERDQPFGTVSCNHLAEMVAGKEVWVVHNDNV